MELTGIIAERTSASDKVLVTFEFKGGDGNCKIYQAGFELGRNRDTVTATLRALADYIDRDCHANTPEKSKDEGV